MWQLYQPIQKHMKEYPSRFFWFRPVCNHSRFVSKKMHSFDSLRSISPAHAYAAFCRFWYFFYKHRPQILRVTTSPFIFVSSGCSVVEMMTPLLKVFFVRKYDSCVRTLGLKAIWRFHIYAQADMVKVPRLNLQLKCPSHISICCNCVYVHLTKHIYEFANFFGIPNPTWP